VWILPESDARFFTEEERLAVEALFEAILPAGERAPSAKDVGAADYLDCLLAREPSPYYEIAGWQQIYRSALPALEAAASVAAGGRSIAQQSLSERTELLARLAQAGLTEFPAGLDQKKFFATLRAHCIEGCFSDPRWGGNRNREMWRWYGYIEPSRDDPRNALTA
jgi:gluconate 2-dehydrogenase gamma chain